MDTQILTPQDWRDIIPKMNLLTVESKEEEIQLHYKSHKVLIFGRELEQFCQALVEHMSINQGIGLAAPQMGVFQRVFVLQTDQAKNPLIVINPLIKPVSDSKNWGEEGCLSIPGIYGEIERWPIIDITAQDPYGKTFQLRLEGIDSICFQHEDDHLNGILFTDYMSRSQQRNIKKYFAEQHRKN